MPPRDPLKISYVLVLPETDGDDTSPFQGFSAGWTGLIGFVEQLATYALRRVMTIDDAVQIKAIAQASKPGGYQLRTVIEKLVTSELFQKR